MIRPGGAQMANTTILSGCPASAGNWVHLGLNSSPAIPEILCLTIANGTTTRPLISHACFLMRMAVTRIVIESDGPNKYPFFDKNKHFFRLNSCKISICGDKMESYVSR